jgi:streptogramin lyase
MISPVRIVKLVTGLLLVGLVFPAAALAAPAAITIQTSLPPGSFSSNLLYGPQGKYWFALAGTGAVGEWEPSAALPTVHNLGDASAKPRGITIGPDRSLWLTEKASGKVVRYKTDGTFTKYSLPNPSSQPSNITAGQDGTIWFSEFNHNRIGRITVLGELTEYELPSPDSKPLGIASDLQGNIWFAEWNGYRIGKLTPDGVLTEYPIALPPSRPNQIVLGPDGAMWFTYELTKQVGRIDPLDGTITPHLLPTASSGITSLAIGPDGRLWFLGIQTVGSFDITTGAPTGLVETPLPTAIFEGLGGNQIIAGPDGRMTFITANTQNVYSVEPVTNSRRDLQVFIGELPDFVLAGGPFSFETHLANWSSDPATNTIFRLNLSEGMEFVSANSGLLTCASVDIHTVDCTHPAFPGNTVQAVTFTLLPTRAAVQASPAILDLQAFSAGGDYLPANNRSYRMVETLQEYIYQTDFSLGPDSFWQPGSQGTVDGQPALGLFDNDRVTLRLPLMPPHDRASICFDLYILGEWDGSSLVDPANPANPPEIIGPDLWAYYMNDTRLLVSSFSNHTAFAQSYPDDYAAAEHAPRSWAAQIGDFDGAPVVTDARYRICTTQTHHLAEFLLTYYGLNLNRASGEKWALDNVIVRIYYRNAFDYIYLPALVQ